MHGSPHPARLGPATRAADRDTEGEFVPLEGELYFRIAAYHRLAPFLMSVPSDTDLWMFVASGGGLTAGRVDADGALFPYETVDRLHDAHHHTGPVTLIAVESPGSDESVWEPFTEAGDRDPEIERALYKNTTGNRVVFEEIHRGLGLRFRYRWSACDRFGWVRTSTLENLGPAPTRLRLLDGLRNLLPWGAPLALYQQSSNLVDAYKQTEVDPESGLAIFSLTARITDRTEALEVLRANTVFCSGLDNPRVHLSLDAIADFRAGRVLRQENETRGVRGNYLVSTARVLEPAESARWHFVGDTGLDQPAIVGLQQLVRDAGDLPASIEAELDGATKNLRRHVASADGLQISGHTASWVHHFANVLFNAMRGGIFLHDYDVPVADLMEFLRTRNREVAARHGESLGKRPGTVTIQELLEEARESGDPDFERLCHEYLPLHFSRRHGDPSRPWNRFAIRVRNGHGQRELNYEGNWRDIFQNWEALARAFPGFLPSMVAKFVNASTVDGFNPYRVTRDGVEWEVPAPEDPWSNIGYWGDHQIIYLLKLLESLDAHDPGALEGLLGREIFSYVEVPYRIKPYAEILVDPTETIDYDAGLDARIEARVEESGSDGKLLHDADGAILRANLFEKLLVPLLSKLSNLVPDAGIWMNTQRPEWNDANNALGGGGVSVVTLCYLRRYLHFLAERLRRAAPEALPVSREVVGWFGRIAAVLDAHPATGLDDVARRRIMDELGQAFCDYRRAVYETGPGEKVDLRIADAIALCETALRFVDAGIAANRREDGLFHTYNRLDLDGGARVLRLPEMLEGQVAALSSGLLDPAAALDLLQRLFASQLYSPPHRSFLLYPAREPGGFLERNRVPAAKVEAIGLLDELLEAGVPAILARDADGVFRFHGDLGNADDLEQGLTRLAGDPRWSEAVARDRQAVLDLFEEVFDHGAYTGRSGAMYAFEGLGCVYWHMVAKLLLAVQENCERAADQPAAVHEGLARMYYRVRAGIGYEKTVSEYGAFPTDPYSHTPADGTARQPGMTGQVKEEILTRIGELGVRVDGGTVRFAPTLLRGDELLGQPARFEYFDQDGTARAMDLPAGSLAFTLCQVPVVYEASTRAPWIEIGFADGSTTELPHYELDAALSRELFARSGRVERIRVGIAYPASVPL